MFIDYDDDTTIGMVEGDFGIVLPIEIEDIEISSNDSFNINIFKKVNEIPILIKTYSNVSNNTIDFKLTKEESELLKVGSYYYDIDWFRGEEFLSNITAKAKFKVLDKAGA